MISILGGDLLCALGDKETRLNHLKQGTYQTINRSMTIFDEQREYPYYQLASDAPLTDLYDPITLFIPTLARLIEKLQLDKNALSRCGLFLGCSANDLSISHPLWLNNADPEACTLTNKRVGNGDYAARLTKHFSLNSFSLTYNTACTSSANALIDASTMLQAGVIDYALVIGLEMFAQMSYEGFSSMQLLANDCVKPFDQDRQGLVLGESLAAVFLSRKEIQDSDWTFKGGVSRSETASVTGSKQDGSGIYDVMHKALISSDIKSEQIDFVKAHGTGSPMGDVAEINGMKQLFQLAPKFFSFKPYIGHTLGACGVSELLLLIESVNSGFIPSTPNFKSCDEQLGWSPLQSKQTCLSGTFLLNYFGFGGNNTSLVISKRNT
jgi:3-oxoacyl-(acyl-carrier-protein) synthase